MVRHRLGQLRAGADRFIHHPWVELGILLLILLSVALLLAELALPTGPTARAAAVAGEVITGIFVVELSIRFAVARKKSRFFQRYWIDILAVLPAVRALRVFRVLRVLRLVRAGALYNRRLSVLSGAGRLGGRGSDAAGLVAGMGIVVVLAAVALYLGEGPVNSGFDEFGEAMWFAAYSLVGGEPIGAMPQTELGRWVTLLLMMGGLSIFGVIVGAVSAGMVRRLQDQVGVHEMDLDELRDHVVVCGWNGSGPTVLRELFAQGGRGRAVVLVTERSVPADELPTEGVPAEALYVHTGDFTRIEVLQEVGVPFAATAVLLADTLVARSNQDTDARTVLAALTIEGMSEDIYTVAELHTRQSEALLRRARVEEIVVADWFAGAILGTAASHPGVVAFLDEVLTQAHGDRFHTLEVGAERAGRRVRALHEELYARHGALLVAVVDDRGVDVNPSPTRAVDRGAQVVVLSGAKRLSW